MPTTTPSRPRARVLVPLLATAVVLAAAMLLAPGGASRSEAQSPPTGPSTVRGTIMSGEVPETGFGLFVFGGGTEAELATASDCGPAARFWAVNEGDFVVLIPSSRVAAVNAAWRTLFATEIPEGTVLIGTCGGSRGTPGALVTAPPPPGGSEDGGPVDTGDGIATAGSPPTGLAEPAAPSPPGGGDEDLQSLLDDLLDALGGIEGEIAGSGSDGQPPDPITVDLEDLQDLIDQLLGGSGTP